MSLKTDCPQTNNLINRLIDLEVGDAIINRYPSWMLRDARRAIGKLAKFDLDDDTNVLTCVKKSGA